MPHGARLGRAQGGARRHLRAGRGVGGRGAGSGGGGRSGNAPGKAKGGGSGSGTGRRIASSSSSRSLRMSRSGRARISRGQRSISQSETRAWQIGRSRVVPFGSTTRLTSRPRTQHAHSLNHGHQTGLGIRMRMSGLRGSSRTVSRCPRSRLSSSARSGASRLPLSITGATSSRAESPILFASIVSSPLAIRRPPSASTFRIVCAAALPVRS